jgi:cell division protein FtsB
MKWHEQRHRLGRLAIPLAVLGTVAYLGFHFLEGERGLRAWWALSNRLDRARQEHEALRAEREKLDSRVALLREATLDRDLLDERVRRMLQLLHPGEVVVLYDKPLTPDPKLTPGRSAQTVMSAKPE